MTNCYICKKKINIWSSYNDDEKDYCENCWKNKVSQIKEKLKIKDKEENKRIEEFNRREGGKVTFIEQYDSFIKRLSPKEATQGRYETRTVLNQPCYVGWCFLRILADGSVIPCLKAHRMPSGNLYQHSIKDIWNSEAQQLFRKKSFALDSEDAYFKMIGNDPSASFGCINSCDNIQINVDMHNRFAKFLRFHGRIK